MKCANDLLGDLSLPVSKPQALNRQKECFQFFLIMWNVYFSTNFDDFFPWCVITRYFVWLLPDIEVSTWDKRPKLLFFILSPLFYRIFHYIPCLISCPYFSNRFHLALIVSEIKKKRLKYSKERPMSIW